MCLDLHAILTEITQKTSWKISEKASEETSDQILLVRGCQAVGKSVEVYSFAMFWARKY